jgi:2-dehydropantoate 2-reductase
LKLVRNASNGALSALIRQPLAAACGDPDLQQVAAGLIRETLSVAAALGWDVRSEVNVADLTKRSDSRGGPRSSTLQDVLLGRPLEVEALVGQTQAFAREAHVPVPTIDIIVPLLRALDNSLALERSKRNQPVTTA